MADRPMSIHEPTDAATLARVREAVTTDRYPCPFMFCDGEIYIAVDRDHDDMGYVVASWPVFRSECADKQDEWRGFRYEADKYSGALHCFTKRTEYDDSGRSCGWTWQDDGPVNHGAQLNWRAESYSYSDEESARLLGMLSERKRIARLLGMERGNR